MKRAQPATAAGKRHMEKIAAMPCIVYELLDIDQPSRTEVHHIRSDREERNDFLTLPLCKEAHTGPHGVHGDKGYLRMLKMSEWALLAIVIKRLTA